MLLPIWRFITLLLAALGLVMGGAHVLELPAKMRYDGGTYAAVNSTLYQLFGTVGAVLTVGAILAAAVLAFLVRGRPSFRWTVLGALALTLSFVLWLTLVAPVNAEWRQVIEAAPASVPEAYLRLRDRWEYGHVAAFVAWLTGFCLLVVSVLVETPTRAERATGSYEKRLPAEHKAALIGGR